VKTVFLPQVPVEPKLRADLESVLRDGESVSDFVIGAVRREVEFRLLHADFYARGDVTLQDYRRTGESYPINDVLNDLRAMTEARRKQLAL
jgi:hypothetical protein